MRIVNISISQQMYHDDNSTCQATVQSGPHRGNRCSCRAVMNLRVCGRHATKNECSICLTSSVYAISHPHLSCRHTFHPACIDAWLQKHNTCPNCRHPTRDRLSYACRSLPQIRQQEPSQQNEPVHQNAQSSMFHRFVSTIVRTMCFWKRGP